MPTPKFLWRAHVRGLSKPIYLVAQNMASAHAQASNNPQVRPADVSLMQRIDEWNEQENRTKVMWPLPPLEPPDIPGPPP